MQPSYLITKFLITISGDDLLCMSHSPMKMFLFVRQTQSEGRKD